MSLKNGPRRRNRGLSRRSLRLSILLVGAAIWCVGARGADRLKELQEKFDRDTHAESKVKDLQKLSPWQFDAATSAGKTGDYVMVGLIFEKYRDNVRQAFELLRKQEPDADHHPNGYRQLELEVRRGIREVSDTMLVAPEAVRPPLEIVRKDLIDTDDALINLLFPRRTKDSVRVPPPPAAEAKP